MLEISKIKKKNNNNIHKNDINKNDFSSAIPNTDSAQSTLKSHSQRTGHENKNIIAFIHTRTRLYI